MKKHYREHGDRAHQAMHYASYADYWVGIEGGVQKMDAGLMAFAWVVIRSRQQTGKARTASFFLPQKVTALIREGKEMGAADDIVFGRTNSKQQNGAIGLLTGDVINRVQLYEPAVILALIPFCNPQLYESQKDNS